MTMTVQSLEQKRRRRWKSTSAISTRTTLLRNDRKTVAHPGSRRKGKEWSTRKLIERGSRARSRSGVHIPRSKELQVWEGPKSSPSNLNLLRRSTRINNLQAWFSRRKGRRQSLRARNYSQSSRSCRLSHRLGSNGSCLRRLSSRMSRKPRRRPKKKGRRHGSKKKKNK